MPRQLETNGKLKPNIVNFKKEKKHIHQYCENIKHYELDKHSNIPFSIDRLIQEPEVIRRIFWALYLIKVYRIKILEFRQYEQNASLILRMGRERLIHEIKKQSNQAVSELINKFSRIKACNERELSLLRKKLNKFFNY